LTVSAPYRVEITPSAWKALAALPAKIQRRIDAAILLLSEEPRPPRSVKLEGALYRIRVGDHRIVYEVRDDVLLVVVVRVAHRREVYRNL
jgi:mRNA interferase RelE/StbE